MGLLPQLMGDDRLCSTCLRPSHPHFLCASKISRPPFCRLMKANTVQLPNLTTAVPSQQRGDRTDGPKLRDKASPDTPALASGETELGTEG